MPENNEDFRKLLDEKFKLVHTTIDLQFNSIQSTLDSIDAQVKRTNGRVTKLEDVTSSLVLKEATHLINCPQSNRFKEIEQEIDDYKKKMYDDLEEYNFFKRYPKIAIGIIATAVLIMLLGVTEVRSYITAKQVQTTIQTNTKTIDTHGKEIDANSAADKSAIKQQNKINQDLENQE